LRVGYLEGYLHRQSDVKEGEHTGYILHVEVELSSLEAVEELLNERVAVTGALELIDYPERGKELVFKVTSAAAIDENVEEGLEE
jgi:hypothetical protein